MPIPIDVQIEALEQAWERRIARCRLGASPYDDDDLPEADSRSDPEINDRD